MGIAESQTHTGTIIERYGRKKIGTKHLEFRCHKPGRFAYSHSSLNKRRSSTDWWIAEY